MEAVDPQCGKSTSNDQEPTQSVFHILHQSQVGKKNNKDDTQGKTRQAKRLEVNRIYDGLRPRQGNLRLFFQIF